jgi:hypothetical protein
MKVELFQKKKKNLNLATYYAFYKKIKKLYIYLKYIYIYIYIRKKKLGLVWPLQGAKAQESWAGFGLKIFFLIIFK